ncbi:MAG TPA: PqqD family peptide modification chaperone [Actinomycetota bacterium]|nr:PqqD family peptide modification chaperone [Actinomycetota bacterium]
MSQQWRPVLATNALLRYDPTRRADVLLLPERAVLLNPSAGAILRCDARHTPEDIERELRDTYREQGSDSQDSPDVGQMKAGVARFLQRARALGWVR